MKKQFKIYDKRYMCNTVDMVDIFAWPSLKVLRNFYQQSNLESV